MTLSRQDALALAEGSDLSRLLGTARALRDQRHPASLSYSPKVFIPLTQLCRDVCHYCTFAQTPKRLTQPYLLPEQVVDIARRGAEAGCHEALFTLGDKPELRYSAARDALKSLGYESTLSYLKAMAELVWRETGLLPHLNPGVMDRSEIAALRPVAVSMGIMLESSSLRLLEKGGPHYGSPDKHPGVRLATIAAAGTRKVPLTSGILIGIGETRRERIESLLALRDLHTAYGHIQEVIVQNFRRKPGTVMANAPEPDLEELQWTIAIARILFGPDMNVQAPPNLSSEHLAEIIDAGINDWGGVSPVTPDHVNPEAPWPHLEELAEQTRCAGRYLVERLAIYPDYAMDTKRWLAPEPRQRVHDAIDSRGLARRDDWMAGTSMDVPALESIGSPRSAGIQHSDGLSKIIDRAVAGQSLSETDVVRLFAVEGDAFSAVVDAADALRRDVCGDDVTYVVNRNINYTNVCYFKCQFCAFSKGKMSENLRGSPYVLDLEEIERRRQRYLADQPRVDVAGRTAIVIDDGIATGATLEAALHATRRAGPERLILAVPVAPPETIERLRAEVDEIVCLQSPKLFGAIGLFYAEFHQLRDDEVVDLLACAKTDEPAADNASES